MFSISLLAMSISFDIDLFNGKSTRQPNTNQFIDTICEQLQQAIEIYEKKSLSKIKFCPFVYFYFNGIVSQCIESRHRN
jgi:hypothetical protein